MQDFDVVILGAGPAGLTAGLVAAQQGLRTIVIDQMGVGGQVLNVEKIGNMPGFPEGIAGYELGPMIQEQCEAAGTAFALDTVTSLEPEEGATVVHCAEEDYRGRAVIVCLGSSLRKLGQPEEERLEGRGISHCASCDGAFFTGQTVAVAGGGDSALEEAAVLAGQVEKVLVFFPGEAPHAQDYLIKAALEKPNIELHAGTTVEAILGEDAVEGIRVREVQSGEVREQAISGIFIYTGLEPNTRFLESVLELDGGGHIVTDIQLRTSRPGVFAAGDIRQHAASLVASSIGDGATAAVAASRYLRGEAWPPPPG